MSDKNIPAGYQLHVDTWQNDGDHSKTKIISGLIEADVRFYIDIAQRFRSQNAKPKGLGNHELSDGELVELVDKVLASHPRISNEVRAEWTPTPEDMRNAGGDPELIEELKADVYYDVLVENVLGDDDEVDYHDDGRFCRAFEGFKVFYLESAVKDVTKLFGKTQ